jgi:ferredoxin
MKVVVDRALCVGHAQCSAICPAVFTNDELGYAVVVADGSVAPEHRDDARGAAESCPEQAITVTE